MTGQCECGKECTGDYSVWNGMHVMDVCKECFHLPENIAMEACVDFAEKMSIDYPSGRQVLTFEECVRKELAFRGAGWTESFQAYADRCYLEWYLEPAL